MRLQIIVILLVIVGVATGLAQLGEEHITITVTSEGKAKISQALFPKTFVSTIDVHIISEKISNLLAIDEKNILLGTTQNQELLKIATLGASAVDLKYNAAILAYESGVFRLKYNSDLESRVNLPPLSKLVSLNTIPVKITDKEYVLPPGDISLSYTIRPVTSKEFFVPVGDSEQKVEAITAAKIEEFSANSDEISFIIKDKAIILTIIPKLVMTNPNDALLNGEEVDFSQFYQNATHSWIRIDPHEKGLVRILNEPNEGGGCLIATATYGSEMAPQVQFLREIRDNQLMNTDSGISFMTGFNQLYYSFSPYIADMERENPVFKEFVKIAITPMLLSLSIMTVAESENEILGFGVGVILMNVGMYFVLPFVICYYVKKIVRTRGVKQSNLRVKSNYNVLSVVKTSLFGLIALLVLTVSVSSTFETAYAEGEDPIQIVLDITHQNILDSLEDAGINPENDPYYTEAKLQYDAAIAALNSDDPNIVAAKNSALIAMALFEKSAEEIGALEDPTQLPPGLNTAVTNLFEVQERITDIDNEVNELRGLIESNNLDINLEEYDNSVNLAKEVLANGDIPDAQAKLALANEIKDNLYKQIDDAVAANQDDREAEFVENTKNTIEEMLENGENLGLTEKAIRELEDVLEAIENGETDEVLEKTGNDSEFAKELEDAPGNSGDAPGQENKEAPPGNSGDATGQNKEDAPGNSGDAPGQNRGNEDAELPPGFGAAGNNPNDNAKDNGNGLGKIPPGLAKLFGYDDGTGDNKDFEAPEGLPPGFGAAIDSASDTGKANGIGLGLGGENIPPGLQKKFDVSFAFNDNLDDYFENHYESQIDDDYEKNFDGTNKGHGDGKGKFGAFPGRSGEAPGQLKKSDGSPGVGNDITICHEGVVTLNISSNALAAHIPAHPLDTLGACVDGILDGDSENTSGDIGVLYTVQGFTAVNNGDEVDLSTISLDVFAPNGTLGNTESAIIENDGDDQPFSFTPDVNGIWEIRANRPSMDEVVRTINVGGINTAPTITISIGYLSSFCILNSDDAAAVDLRLLSLDNAVTYADAETPLENLTIEDITGTSFGNTAAIVLANQNAHFDRIYEVTDDDATNPLTTQLTVDVQVRNNYQGPSCVGQP